MRQINVFERNIYKIFLFTFIVGFICYGKCGDFENLHFPSLESIKIQYFESYFYKWVQFFKNHQHLKILTMSHCSVEQLIQLTANLSSLEEVTVVSNVNIGQIVAQEIRGLLQSRQSLKKFHLLRSHNAFDDSQKQTLCDSIQNEWDFYESKVYYDEEVMYDSMFIRKDESFLE